MEDTSRSIESCPHNCFDTFSTVHSKIIELCVLMRGELDVHATITCPCDIFGHHFDVYLTIHTTTICMCFHFDPPSRVFSNRRVIQESG